MDVDWNDIQKRAYNAILMGLIFVAVSHPMTYRIVDMIIAPLFGRFFRAFEGGCPSTGGVILHGVVFAAVAFGISYINY
jgi:hypothetical protein